MSSYKVKGNWSDEATYRSGNTVVAVEETSDLIDTRGSVYICGAHRVKLVEKVDGFRTKTFKGETAWSDAQRYAQDALVAYRMENR